MLSAAEKIVGQMKIANLLAISVVMVDKLGMDLTKVFNALGISRATAARNWKRLTSPKEASGKSGGRHRQYMSKEQEEVFLAAWGEKSQAGAIITIAEMRDDFERRSGRAISDVGLYKLLARNGWRKIRPDNKHPKASAEAQSEFKKKSAGRGEAGKGKGCVGWAWIPGDVSG